MLAVAAAMHRLDQGPLLHAGDLADPAQVRVPQDRVGEVADDRQHRVHEAGLAARGAQIVGARVDVDEVVHDRACGPDLLAPSIRLVAQDLVRVPSLRQAHDADVVQLHAGVAGGQLADDLLQRGRPERAGLLARRVDVVGEGDALRIAGDQRHLLGRERGAQARDDVLEARLVRHQRIRVALDDHGLAGLADRRLGAVDEVQGAALVEQRGRRRVEVLRAGVRATLTLLAQDPAAEADGVAARVADREDHPLPEPVIDATAALARAREADLEELLRRHLALRGQLADQLVPASRRPAQLVLLDGLVREAAAAEIVQRGRTGLRTGQDRVVEGDGALENRAQAGVVGVLALRPLVQLDAGPGGKLLERLGEREGVALHHEREDVPVLAAPEAVPRVARRGDDEGRRLLAVKRAQPLEGGARLLQLDRLPHHVRDGQAALDLGDDADRQPQLLPGIRVLVPAEMTADLSSLDRPRRRPRVPPAGGLDKESCQVPLAGCPQPAGLAEVRVRSR